MLHAVVPPRQRSLRAVTFVGGITADVALGSEKLARNMRQDEESKYVRHEFEAHDLAGPRTGNWKKKGFSRDLASHWFETTVGNKCWRVWLRPRSRRHRLGKPFLLPNHHLAPIWLAEGSAFLLTMTPARRPVFIYMLLLPNSCATSPMAVGRSQKSRPLWTRMTKYKIFKILRAPDLIEFYPRVEFAHKKNLLRLYGPRPNRAAGCAT
ncbi:hypothetical protein C8R46DRAFT_1037954 [Mycena filopes]|nr:hypothetical protein C8R46DRAFT_1037954 [Mycena filopes]